MILFKGARVAKSKTILVAGGCLVWDDGWRSLALYAWEESITFGPHFGARIAERG